MSRITPTTIDIVVNDCGYGFSAYAVQSDGTRACHTKELKPTIEAARNDVVRSINTSLPHLQDWIASQDLAGHLKSAGMIALQFGPGLDPAMALPILKQAVYAAMEDSA
jgi:hypothetical protein